MSTLAFILLAVCHVAFADVPVVQPEFLDMLRATRQDEVFAKYMGIEDVSLVRPKEGEQRNVLSNVSPLGDILLTKEQEEQARQGINFNRYPGSKWGNSVIPYYISTSDFTFSQRSLIEKNLNFMNTKHSKLQIRKYQSTDKDYVMVISGNGCYSSLGRVGGQQTVSLQSNGCLSNGTIQHEFIHAAGMLHEQSRPDRDSFITVLYENIPPEWQSQYDKQSSTDFNIQGAYDYYSVMHYPYLAPGTGKPAFRIDNNSIDPNKLGQRDGVTPTDVQKMNVLYP